MRAMRVTVAACMIVGPWFGGLQETRAQVERRDLIPNPSTWVTFTHPILEYSLRYPPQIFDEKPLESAIEGRLWVARDGRAQLLAGVIENASGMSARAYRDVLLKESFPGAKLDYAPLKADWFVISGVHEHNVFYQRVTFTCDGKLISSWLMIYPSEQAALYDRVVEGIHKSYRPSRGTNGSCSIAAGN